MAITKYSADFLRQKQAMPLEAKIILSQQRIRQFYDKMLGNVCVNFSGGKDSTVLLHLVRDLYPKVPAVFVDTGLEYPEIREFVKTIDNVIWLKPKKSFYKVIKEDGFPVVSKKVALAIKILQNPTEKNKNVRKLYLTGITREGKKSNVYKLSKKWKHLINAPFKISDKCCDIIKKEPLKRFKKEEKLNSFIGTMAQDSQRRALSYIKSGCNIYNDHEPMSKPLSIWLETDIWNYIKKNKLNYSKIYDKGYKGTGCIFCMFGLHLCKRDGKENRFNLLKKTHPKLYSYCMNKLGLKDVIKYTYDHSNYEQLNFAE